MILTDYVKKKLLGHWLKRIKILFCFVFFKFNSNFYRQTRPLGRETPPFKKVTPTNPHQGLPLPHLPRTTSKLPRGPLPRAKQPTYIAALSVPLNMQIVPPLKDIPSAPSFVKPLEHGHSGEAANLKFFDHPFPYCLAVNDELIPNPVLTLILMPLFVVGHFDIAFNPNVPKHDVPLRRCQLLIFLPYFLGILSPKMACFQLKLS